MIVRLLGVVVVLAGLLLALFAILGWLFSSDSDDKFGIYLAYGLGGLAIILLLIGFKWTKYRRSTSWRDDPATDKQREFAAELGIKFPKNITKGELSDLITEVTGK